MAVWAIRQGDGLAPFLRPEEQTIGASTESQAHEVRSLTEMTM